MSSDLDRLSQLGEKVRALEEEARKTAERLKAVRAAKATAKTELFAEVLKVVAENRHTPTSIARAARMTRGNMHFVIAQAAKPKKNRPKKEKGKADQ
jgi:hypothetical protein